MQDICKLLHLKSEITTFNSIIHIMELIVDNAQRYAKMRAHTATHLLHAELTKLFPQTKQAGSLVDKDYLRFDFYADRLLCDQETSDIESAINSIITNALTVTVEEKNFNDATLWWAKAFFEDKYGDVVRVVSVLNDDSNNLNWGPISVELCWGTHVNNTKDIGAFVVVWQQAVASWIKRITAYTGPKVRDCIQEKNTLLVSLSAKLECSTAQLEEKVWKLVSDYELLQNEVESNNRALLQSATFDNKSIWEISYNFLELGVGAYKNLSVKDAQVLAKKWFVENTLITDSNKWFLIYSPNNQAKKLMNDLGWKGGGSDTMCQGKIS